MADIAAEGYWGEPQTVERAGSTLHYWTVGQSDAPVVVCTHGASMDHRMFNPQHDALLQAGFRLLVWDMRGHGLSKPIGDEFSVAAATDDLHAILDAVGAEKVTLVGHSFGGYVSQEFLYQYPDRVKALVTIGSSDITVSGAGREELLLASSPYLFRAMPDSLRRRLVAQSTAVRPSVRDYAYNATSQLSKDEFTQVWRAVADHPRPEREYRIPCPFLLTHGEKDMVGTIAKHAPAWAARQPNAVYRVIDEAGHNANQDNPKQFNEELCAFLLNSL